MKDIDEKHCQFTVGLDKTERHATKRALLLVIAPCGKASGASGLSAIALAEGQYSSGAGGRTGPTLIEKGIVPNSIVTSTVVAEGARRIGRGDGSHGNDDGNHEGRGGKQVGEHTEVENKFSGTERCEGR